MDALNVAYGETEKRGFVRLNLVALAFTLGTILAVMLALGAVVVAPIVLSQLGLSGASELYCSRAELSVTMAGRRRSVDQVWTGRPSIAGS